MKRKGLSKKRLKVFHNKVIARVFTETLHAPQLGRVNGQLTVVSHPIFTTGFDTLRIGLPKHNKNYQANEDDLLRLCSAVGATLHKVKWSHPTKTVKSATGKDIIKPEITTDRTIQAHWAKTLKPKKRKRISMREFFSYSNGAWVIEYAGAMHWLIDWQSGNTLSFELYGLSQLHHSLGAVRFELLDKILAYYSEQSPDYLPILTGYDWHIDINKPFDWMIQHFVVPYTYLYNLTAKNGKRKIYSKYAKGTYLQTDTYKGDRTIVVYDKNYKNDLIDIEELSRFELRVKLTGLDRVELYNYASLDMTHWKELNHIGLIPQNERERYCNYLWD